jgi:hypothetical protein
VERADQVLALGRIDAGLAADGTIDLGKQGRGDLHEAHAAAQDARGKAGQIANHAAAEGDDEVAALQAQRQKLLAQWLQFTETLGFFSCRKDHGADEGLARPQACLQRIKVVAGDVHVRHDGAAGGAEPLGDDAAGFGGKAWTDQYVVGPPG